MRQTGGVAGNKLTRRLLRIVLILLAATAVLAPLLIVRYDFTTFPKEPKLALAVVADALALFALSFIFLDIVTGAFRPLLIKVFRPGPLLAAHMIFGVTGLLLVLVHLSLLLPYIGSHYAEANHLLFFFGPLALLLLLITVGTALFRKRLRSIWQRIHLLNYIIFAIAVAHGLVVGPDGTGVAMQAVLCIFAAVVLAGFVYRFSITDWKSKLAGGKARR
jgi:methionine sulfoxide reductase heme-binding subunit